MVFLPALSIRGPWHIPGQEIIADRHHPLRKATEGLLGSIFNTVVMVSSFESLIHAAQRMPPDLILVDLSLPSSDGGKLTLNIDKALNNYKIIVLGHHILM